MFSISRQNIRNFCIIAHIDHGKSTLADRLLEITGVVEKRQMSDRFLDRLDLEKEKGITIKLKAVRLPYQSPDGCLYHFNLIDTPGHVDFSYEVSRSLAACEGALLLVDAAQGVQSQTISNAYRAIKQGLVLIPVVNKIDLAEADPDRVACEVGTQLGFSLSEIVYTSGRTGEGVPELLETIVRRIPVPRQPVDDSLRALVFDSFYDQHQGVVAFVRLFSGSVKSGDSLRLLATGAETQTVSVGVAQPAPTIVDRLGPGDVGYIVTGLKELRQVTVGDTISRSGESVEALPGYTPAKPMVFAGFYPADQDKFSDLADALDRFKLQDAALSFNRESSSGLGRGFRCGFLGTLHLEIVKERLEREYSLEILVTAPSVKYQIITLEGRELVINRPQDLPERYQEIREPWVSGEILVPQEQLGDVMKFCENSRGILKNIIYPETASAICHIRLEYDFPLSELLSGFYDGLKSVSSGYASFDYQLAGYRPADAVRLDILIHGELIEPLSQMVLRERASVVGRGFLLKLKELLPRQQFAIALQAVIGSKVVARENIPALRKDVTAKLYGGDRTRKDKLLNKQKKGKAKLRQFGKVAIPSEVFYQVLSS